MKVDLTKYSTIIFDFGGVIFDINPELSINALKKYGGNSGLKAIEDSGILWEFERGEISKDQLYEGICKLLKSDIPFDAFIDAWNALLLRFKSPRIDALKKLSDTHQLFLLSNTNEIHFEKFSGILKEEYHLTFNDLFDKVYLSYEMGYVKPDKAIYQQVIDEQELVPEKTLFIEDTEANAKAAEELKINTLVIPRNGTFYEYFK